MTGPAVRVGSLPRVRSLPRVWALTVVALAAGLSTLVLPGSAPAAALPRVPLGEPVSDQRAVQLLRSAYDAGRNLRYVGTAFLGVQDTFVQVRIRHLPGTGTYLSLVGGATAGGVREMVQPDAVSDDADLDPLRLLREHYRLVYAGTDRVAGRAAYVVRALRQGAAAETGSGVAATFWIDQRSRLVLAREAYDRAGQRYEQVMFTELAVQGRRGSDPAAPSPSELGALTVPDGSPRQLGVLAVPGEPTQLDRLRAAGWSAPASLPGGFELYDARVVGAGRGAVLHLSYSDGLCAVSVFEQHGRLAAGALDGWRETTMAGRTVYVDGSSPQRLAWQGNGTVFAVLSDATATRVADAVSGLPHGDPGDGVLDRMARGFDRLGSWIDPFD